MKNVFLALVVLVGLSSVAAAGSCSSGSCGSGFVHSGVRTVVSAPVRVVRGVRARASCRAKSRQNRRSVRRAARSSCNGRVTTSCGSCGG